MAPATLAVLGGTGRQGRGIALRFAHAGFTVVIGSRDPQRAADAVAAWPGQLPSISTASYRDAIARASVVFLAVPFDAMGDLLTDNRDAFNSQVAGRGRHGAASCSRADLSGWQRFPTDRRRNTSRRALRRRCVWALRSKRCRHAFWATSTSRSTATNSSPATRAESRDEVAALVQHVKGLRAVDVGPLSNARSIEHLALLAIGINRRYKVPAARFQIVGL